MDPSSGDQQRDAGSASAVRDRSHGARLLPALGPLGMTCERLEPDIVVLRVDADPFVPNPNGAINGGVLTAMTEQAMELLGAQLCEPGASVNVASLHIQFHRPPRTRLTLVATLLPGGRRVKFVEVVVTGADGRRCAGAQGTLVMTEAPAAPSDAATADPACEVEAGAGAGPGPRAMLPRGAMPRAHLRPPSPAASGRDWLDWVNTSPTYAALHLRCHRLDRTEARFTLDAQTLPPTAAGAVQPALLMIAADVGAGALAGRAGPENMMSATGSLYAQAHRAAALPVVVEASLMPGGGRAQAVRVELLDAGGPVMSVSTTMVTGAGARY